MTELRDINEKHETKLPIVSWIFDGRDISRSDDAQSGELPLAKDNKNLRISSQAKIYDLGNNSYKLESGCALLHTKEPTRIEAGHATIVTRGNAALVVHSQNGVLRVLNLCDKKNDTVRIVMDKQYQQLLPGEEALVYRNDHPNPTIAVGADTEVDSQKYEAKLGDAHKITIFNFNYVDALKKCQIYKELTDNTNKTAEQIKTDQHLIDGILKTAAILESLRHPNKTPRVPHIIH